MGKRQQVERRDPDHRHAQRQRQRLAGGEPDAHAGEQARPDVDGDQPELVQPDLGLGADEVDRRGEDLGMAPATPDLEQRDHPLVAAERHADLLGRRLDPEDQHGPLAVRRRQGRPNGEPTSRLSGVIVMRRASASPSSSSRRTTRCSPKVDSDDVAPLDEHDAVELGELAEREVGDLGELVEAVQVGVVQRRPAGVVAVNEGEGRRRDRLGHAQRPPEALGEGRLSGPHLAGEEDDVPAAAERGDGAGDVVGGGEGCRTQL